MFVRRIDHLSGHLAESQIVINSIPKAGTHLLEKAVRLMPGCHPAQLHLEQFTWPDFKTVDAAQVNSIRAHRLSLDELQQGLRGIQRGYYATAHFIFQQDLAELMADMGIKMLFIVRDPRDIALSFAKYVAREESHYLFEYYQTLGEEERIMTAIVGTVDIVAHAPRLFNIKVAVNNMLPWRLQSNVYTTSFEKLIGAAGGGSDAAQLAELRNMARHIKAPCSDRQLRHIAGQLFGGTTTFRKGTIGDWRRQFTAEHKRAFKEIAGQMLIDLGYEKGFDW
jgi:hypothetical protein